MKFFKADNKRLFMFDAELTGELQSQILMPHLKNVVERFITYTSPFKSKINLSNTI